MCIIMIMIIILLLIAVQESPVSPSTPSTFVEYDFDSLQDFSGSSTTTNNNNNYYDSSGNKSFVGGGGDLSSSLGHNGIGTLVGDDSLLTPQFNSTVLAPPASEDEGDSAISGRSSEINENR